MHLEEFIERLTRSLEFSPGFEVRLDLPAKRVLVLTQGEEEDEGESATFEVSTEFIAKLATAEQFDEWLTVKFEEALEGLRRRLAELKRAKEKQGEEGKGKVERT